MVFFKSNQPNNVWACSLSILLLNYNCAVSSFVLYSRNQVLEISDYWFTAASASLMLGLLIGQLLFGVFGDTIGRRLSFLGSAAVMFFGGVLSVFSGLIPLVSGDTTTLIEFTVYRFIMGIGAGGKCMYHHIFEQ
jgi:MFS family permease